MKPFRLFLLLLVLCGAVSCASMGFSSKVQQTSVGMSKKEVIKELGTNYTLVHSMLTPQGDVVEILKFYGGINSYDYEFEFMNDILVRFTQIVPPPQKDKEKEHHHHHNKEK